MAYQEIDTTTVQPSGKIGDPAKTAFGKINENFSELYARPGKNLLINAEGLINQRGFVGGALAAGVYGYDRFKAGTGGCNFSIASGAWTHTSGPIVQIVEAPAGVFGSSVTFSLEDPTGPVAVTIGGVSGTITAGSGRRGVTLAIPAGSGNLTVQWSATGATYSRPQLERGNAATDFDSRPIGEDTALCQRYYRTVLGNCRFQATAANQSGVGTLSWQKMRSAPAVTVSVSGQIGNNSTVFPTDVANITAIGARMNVNSAAAGDTYCLDRIFAADAEL